jgi:BolA protein
VTRAGRIRAALTAALAPTLLEVVDESAKHAGHAGARPEGETHFAVTIVAPAFAGCSRLERQRMVYRLLAAELSSGLHALRLATHAPDEDRVIY